MFVRPKIFAWQMLLIRCVTASAIVIYLSAGLIAQERRQRSSDGESRNAQKKDALPAKTESIAPKDASSDDKQAPAVAHRPLEQELERTSEGKIRFSFRQQPWLDVLRWLADSSGLTLDWQDLPDGVLNLTTQQAFTLDEAQIC